MLEIFLFLEYNIHTIWKGDAMEDLDHILEVARDCAVKRVPTIDQMVRMTIKLSMSYGKLSTLWYINNLSAKLKAKKHIAQDLGECCVCHKEFIGKHTKAKVYCDECLIDRKNEQRRENRKKRKIDKIALASSY